MLFICAVLFAHAGESASAREMKVLWRWHAPGVEIYSPSLSHDGQEVVFVRKLHSPDGHEAELYSEQGLDLPKMAGPRSGDPDVVVMQIGKAGEEKVGWGWDPVFSPDGKFIVFARQKKPITRLRVLAGTLGGNDIVVFDRDAKKVVRTIEPSFGYLTRPYFSPAGDTFSYFLNDAVNGSYGGVVGIGIADFESGSQAVVLPVKKFHGLYGIIGSELLWVDGKMFALRVRPTSPGHFTADKYIGEILNLSASGKVVHRWPERAAMKESIQGLGSAKGRLLVAGEGIVSSLDVSSKKIKKIGSYEGDHFGVVSPNGRWVARPRSTRVEVVELLGGKLVGAWPFKGQISFLEWDRASSRLLVVRYHSKDRYGEMFAYDELVLLKVSAGD